MIDPIELLGRQVPAFKISAETRSLHLARIEAALTAGFTQTTAASSASFLEAALAKFRLHDWRQRATAGLVAFLVAIPSVAAATDGTQPDTWLYPVKLAVEPIWHLVDRDIVAQHRIEEIQIALDGNESIDHLLVRAEKAVNDLDPDSVWHYKLAAIEQTLKASQDPDETQSGLESNVLVEDSGTVEQLETPEVSDNIEETKEADDAGIRSDEEVTPGEGSETLDDDADADDEHIADGSDDDSSEHDSDHDSENDFDHEESD